MSSDAVGCAPQLVLRALPGIPQAREGDDLARLIIDASAAAEWTYAEGDVVVVTSKLLSKTEGRWVDLSAITPDARALSLASETEKDPALVQCILDESVAVSRQAKGVLIVRHRLGFVSANAGIDASNVAPEGREGAGPWVLLMPHDPDRTAKALRKTLEDHYGVRLSIVITDSHGRPFRVGTVGAAVGVAGLPPVWDQVGRRDMDGRALEHTVTALADQVAAAADLVAGQADEGRPVVCIRGLNFPESGAGSEELLRPAEGDLYA
jgi:coenzyme F420-0:L-glutamate ligase/coenzyme F420-1:gamma-L-glutamate ligase